MPSLRPRRVQPNARREFIAATSHLFPERLCVVDGCNNSATPHGRFCTAHGRYRARNGAADPADVLPFDLLESTSATLERDRKFQLLIDTPEVKDDWAALLAGPEVHPGDLLDTPDPSPQEFREVCRQLSFDAQVSLLWRHLDQNSALKPLRAVLSAVVASRWAYLTLDAAAALGASQGEWTKRDHDQAYQTVYGRWVSRRQHLSSTSLPAGVLRRFAQTAESVLPKPLRTPNDQSFLDSVKPLGLGTPVARELISQFRKHQS